MEEGREAGRESKEGRKRKKKGKNGAVFTRILWVRLQRPGLGKGFAISAHCRGSPVAFGRQRPGTTARLGGCRDGVAGTALAVPGRSARSDFRQESDLASWAWHRRPRLTEPTAQGTFWKGLRAPPGGAQPSLCSSHPASAAPTSRGNDSHIYLVPGVASRTRIQGLCLSHPA